MLNVNQTFAVNVLTDSSIVFQSILNTDLTYYPYDEAAFTIGDPKTLTTTTHPLNILLTSDGSTLGAYTATQAFVWKIT
jgi:hypothetical protein